MNNIWLSNCTVLTCEQYGILCHFCLFHISVASHEYVNTQQQEIYGKCCIWTCYDYTVLKYEGILLKHFIHCWISCHDNECDVLLNLREHVIMMTFLLLSWLWISHHHHCDNDMVVIRVNDICNILLSVYK